jgi:hypothetical protein
MNVPRIPAGKGYLGPEWFGCCNTGRRPAIFHSINGKWVVGPEISARETLEQHLHYGPKRRIQVSGASVLVCKTRTSAIHGFTKLCAEVETWNEVQKATYQRDRVKAATGDLAAALRCNEC